MLDLSPLKRTLLKRDGEEESVWPCLALTVYSSQAFPAIGKSAAAALRRYVSSIPQSALRSCVIEDDIRALTPQRLAKDLKWLESPRRGDDGGRIVYSSSAQGSPADYGVHFSLLDLNDDDLVGPLEVNVLRFEWPWSSAEGELLEPFVGLVERLIADLPASFATGGFALSYWHGDRFAANQVQELLARYHGFQHSDIACNNMRDLVSEAHWLTFLSDSLAKRLGGTSKIAAALPPGAAHKTGAGWMLRAAHRPPVVDTNRAAADVGFLPSVSRWLQPLRFTTDAFSGSKPTLDPQRWLARFDERADGPWENRT